MPRSQALAYAARERARLVRELAEFVRFPSVSAQPRHADDVRRCAAWLAARLRWAGMPRVQLIPTSRHPIVMAAWRDAPGRPTLLIYGHYDVQPADLPGRWATPPFEPVVRGGILYGRGASDDKGQLLCHIAALEAYLQTAGALPLNVVCVFEGEEEIGSPGLLELLRRRPELFAADAAVISDTRFLAPGRPAITYALRGGLGMELEVRGQQQDVHSGSFGGALHNPIQALCEIIARLHDAAGRIAIPGIYEQVQRLSLAERAILRRQAPSDAQILRDAHAAHGWGERGYTLYERTTIRPALTLNGIRGGYGGPGGKGIIPARASAKLSFRLAPHQDPRAVERLVRAHLAHLTPPAVRLSVRTLQRSRPVLLDLRHPAFHAASAAYRRGFGAEPVFLRSGGTIPVAAAFVELLALPVVLMGFALPGDRMHAPNERFRLEQLERGTATAIAFLDELGRNQQSSVAGRSRATAAAAGMRGRSPREGLL